MRTQIFFIIVCFVSLLISACGTQTKQIETVEEQTVPQNQKTEPLTEKTDSRAEGTEEPSDLESQIPGRSTTEPPVEEMTSATTTALMAVAPAEPVFVLQIKGAAEALTLIEDSRVWGQITEAPMWEVLWTLFEMKSEVREAQRLIKPGLSIPSHLLGAEILFIVPKFQGLLEISPTLLIQIDRTGDLGEILASAIEVGFANIPDTTMREYDGYTYQVTEPVGPGMRLSFGLIDNLLIASLGEETLRKVVDLYQGKSTASLANDANFSQVMAHFEAGSADRATDFQSMFYVDIENFYEFFKMMYPMAQSRIPETVRPIADQALEWFDLVQSVVGILNLTKDGLLSQSYVQFNPDATANNFLAMLQVPPTTHDSINFVPADVASYGATNLLDFPKLWGMVMGVIDTMPPETSEQIRNGLAAIQTQLNIDIEKDLFSWMSNEIAVMGTGNFILIPTEELGEGDIRTLPDLLVLIRTTNSIEATESLERLANLITIPLGAMANVPIEWQTMDYSGTQIHTIAIPDFQLQPGYAVTDEHVLISTDVSNLKTALDSAVGNVKNLSTVTQFQELRAIAPEMVNNTSSRSKGY